jgi:hypothetical protein
MQIMGRPWSLWRNHSRICPARYTTMHASKYQVSNVLSPAGINARLQALACGDNSVAHLLKALHILTPKPCMATRFPRPCDVIPTRAESPNQSYSLHATMLGCALLAYYVHQLSDTSILHYNLGRSMRAAVFQYIEKQLQYLITRHAGSYIYQSLITGAVSKWT